MFVAKRYLNYILTTSTIIVVSFTMIVASDAKIDKNTIQLKVFLRLMLQAKPLLLGVNLNQQNRTLLIEAYYATVNYESVVLGVKALGFTCVLVSSGFLVNLICFFSIDVLLDSRSTQPTIKG